MPLRYEIKEQLTRGKLTLLVGRQGQPDWQRVGVWVNDDGEPRCTDADCQTMLTAMSASCRHARAAKRYLQRKAKSR